MNDMNSTSVMLQSCLNRVQQGDAEATKQLVGLAYERMRVLAHRIFAPGDPLRVEMDPTELVDEAYVRILRAVDAAKPPSVRDFLSLAALKIRQQLWDEAREYRRRRGGKPRGPDIDDEVNVPQGKDVSPSGLVIRQQFLEAAKKTIEGLTTGERRLFYLLRIREMSQEQAAERLGIDKSTVKRSLREVKLKIFDVIEEHLLGRRLPPLPPERKVAAFEVVEEEFLQSLWNECQEKIQSLNPEEKELVDLLWCWALPEAEAAEVLGVDRIVLQARWQQLRTELPQMLRDVFEG